MLGLMVGMALAGCGKKPAAPAAPTTMQVYGKGEAVVNRLVKGDFAWVTQQFDPTMQKALPETQLKSTWDSVVAQYGAFQSQQMVATSKERGLDVAMVTCQFAKARLKVKVVFNKKLQISGLWINPAN
jgi:hypothetical protein